MTWWSAVMVTVVARTRGTRKARLCSRIRAGLVQMAAWSLRMLTGVWRSVTASWSLRLAASAWVDWGRGASGRALELFPEGCAGIGLVGSWATPALLRIAIRLKDSRTPAQHRSIWGDPNRWSEIRRRVKNLPN